MKTKALLFATFVLLTLLIAGMIGTNDVYQVADKKAITFGRMIRDVRKANLVFVGEIHGIREHHRVELDIIRAFHEADAPIVIGLEMFRAESQKTLDSWVNSTLPLDRFQTAYYDNWKQGWPLYRDIFLYAREHRIPLIGLNIPDEISETIARKGFASLSDRERRQLPPGISCNIDPKYMAFIRKAYSRHARSGNQQFMNFCEAQMVWDKAMAWRLVEYLKKNPAATVVVLAGVGHSWKRGIPEQVAQLSKYTTKVIMPLVPDQVELDTVTIQDADYVVLD